MSESESSVAQSAPSEDKPAEAGRPEGAEGACESPPAAPMAAREEVLDPRIRLLQLAAELARSQNRRMLAEFLRLRRAM